MRSASADGSCDVDAGDHLAQGRRGGRGDELHSAGRESPQHALLDVCGHRPAGAAHVDAELFLARGEPGEDDGAGGARCHEEPAAARGLDGALGAKEFEADRGRAAGGVAELQHGRPAERGVCADKPQVVAGLLAGCRRGAAEVTVLRRVAHDGPCGGLAVGLGIGAQDTHVVDALLGHDTGQRRGSGGPGRGRGGSFGGRCGLGKFNQGAAGQRGEPAAGQDTRTRAQDHGADVAPGGGGLRAELRIGADGGAGEEPGRAGADPDAAARGDRRQRCREGPAAAGALRGERRGGHESAAGGDEDNGGEDAAQPPRRADAPPARPRFCRGRRRL